MRLVMEPLDVLFFRDARAFGAGADHRARTLLPPPPPTFHGALRTFLAWQRGWRPGAPLDPALGSADDPGPLRVRGPFLGRRVGEEVSTRHPFPADAVALSDGAGLRLAPRCLREAAGVASDAGRELPWAVAGDGERLAEGPPAALEARELLRYLRGEDVRPSAGGRGFGLGLGLARPEARVGVALDRGRRTVREGYLYTAELARLLPGAVLVGDAWLEGGPLPEEGVLPLGGEGRLVSFRAHPDDDWEVDEAARSADGARRISLYLLSPGPFPAGSWPPGLEGGGGVLAGRRVRVEAACLGRPVRVGGFDLARGRPRPSRWAVPAGSVYRLELLDGGADEALVRALHGRSLFPAGSPEERLGWGQVLVGAGPDG